MKAIKLFTMAALATAVFASCSNDEDLAQSSYPADNVVRVTTNVEDITTRAFHTTNTLDEFAFCIRNANNIKYSYNNIMMTKEGTNWNPSVQMLWQNSTQPVDIMAYAPFDSRGNTETMIKVKNIQFLLVRNRWRVLTSLTSLYIRKRGLCQKRI